VVRCPVCTKVQVVYVQGPKKTSCYYCGARWIQHGADQDAIIARHAPESALRSMGKQRIATGETRQRVATVTPTHELEAAR
jgi:hypothetical protein